MEIYKEFACTRAASAKEWRRWLSEHHDSGKSVWLIIFKKNSGIASVTYKEAVEEALCFGWVDSKPNKRDEHSYYQFFSPRSPNSNWSKVNKDLVEKLVKEGRMAKPGLQMIEQARQNGTWDALNEVEALVIPADLKEAFDRHDGSEANWHEFPRSVKRGILEWILNARRPETRQKRIAETAAKAAANERANQYR
jgi:uncharacterized protein YdeI (YjbR/CyaY-like superfamily)